MDSIFMKIDWELMDLLHRDYSKQMQSLDIPDSYKSMSVHVALEKADAEMDIRTFKILLYHFPFLHRHIEKTKSVWQWNLLKSI